jgi:tetratricopeptide (TPR) repeat protein
MMKPSFAKLFCALFASALSTAVIAQGAHAKEQLGNVKFPVSCAPVVQPKFDRAMALYHSFDWPRGKQAFTEIAQLDARCAMAQWGLAMVASDNPFGWPVSLKLKDGADAIKKAKELGAPTPRERDYIEALEALYADFERTPHRPRALAYEQAMEKLAAKYPQDVEAKVLHALAVSTNHDLNDKTYARPLKAAALLEPLFKAYPEHPGVAHYLIHSYDYPPIAAKGQDAAKRYSRIAPSAAHARHMPSHIFTRVGFWRESVASNQESVKVAGGNNFDALHGLDYLAYAYLQLGEDAKADKVLAEALARGPATDRGFAEPFALAAIPSRLALERGRWADAAKLELTPLVTAADWGRFPHAESVLVFSRGLGAARSGDAAGARRQIERLRALHATLTERKLGYWAEQTEVQAKIVTAWALKAEGKDAEALAAMRAATDHEDSTEKHAVVPGPILPARELLADMLMETGKPAEALPQYEASLGKEPNRFRGLAGAGLASERSGDMARARAHYEKLVAMCAASESARPELARARQLLAAK